MQIKLRTLSCLFFLFIGINTFALEPTATQRLKNLRTIHYPGKFAVTESIKELYRTADTNDAYSLSLPLIASSQQGNKELYGCILERMELALNKMPNDYFKAWILGRVLLAADSIGDKITLKRAQSQLKIILAAPKNKAFTDVDYAFYAWASGYLAALNVHEYKIMQSEILEAAQNLTAAYYQTQTHDALSNAVWAWVLNLQAASYANDMPIYLYILNQILLITDKGSLDEALSFALIRTDTSSDYPAWGMGIVELSAATIHDKLLFKELEAPLKLSIQKSKNWGNEANQTPANQWKGKAEATLGELNHMLSIIRNTK